MGLGVSFPRDPNSPNVGNIYRLWGQMSVLFVYLDPYIGFSWTKQGMI